MSLSLSRKRRLREESNSQNDSSAGNKRSCGETPTQPRWMAEDGTEDSRRCGKVLRMHLTNFMCHSNLSIDFHSRVNFLVGQNGSGKSAVLAALVLGLGSSAKTTNRSRNAKAFIKSGEHTAKIEIDLANDGPQPYEHKTYGDKITIIRTLSMSSGSYVIKNAAGHVVSKKVDDLHRILMYHNVQVDNPVFVLNQDSAREFLKDLDPSKNYKLFLKATQVDIVTEKLEDCLHMHRSHVTELQNFKTRLEKQKADINEHKEKLNELLSYEKLKDELNEFELLALWCAVGQAEDHLQELNERLNKLKVEKQELKNIIQNKEEVNEAVNEEIKKYESLVDSKDKEYDKLNAHFRTLNANMEEMTKRSSNIQLAIDSVNKKRSRLETQVNDLKQYIYERSMGNQDDVEEERKAIEKQIAELREKCTRQIEPRLENLKEKISKQIETKSQNDRKVYEIKNKHQECTAELRRTFDQIATAQASVKDKLLIYGNYMPQLLKEIQKAYSEGLFSKLPRGPIGNYLEIPKKELCNVIENVIGAGILGAFCVNTSKDRQLLEKILGKFCPKLPVIISGEFSEQVYDVSKGCVHPIPETTMLMDEINCSDPVALNCLIDHVHIETILLTKNKELAEHITSNKRNVLKFLGRIIVLTEHNMTLEYYPMPKYRMYSTKLRHANFLQQSVTERIRQLENEKESLEHIIQSLENDLQYLEQQIPQNSKSLHEYRKLFEKEESSKKEVMEKIADLENIEFADYNNELEILKTEMKETQGQLAKVDEELMAKRAELANAKIGFDSYTQELSEKGKTLRTLEVESERLQAKVEQLKAEKRRVVRDDNSNWVKMNSIDEELKKLTMQDEQYTRKVVTSTAKALERGERIEITLSMDEIQSTLSKIKAKMKLGKPLDTDPQTLHKLIIAKEEDFEACQGNYINIKAVVDSMRKSLKSRFDFIKKLKEHMALLLQLTFSMILKFRDFDGYLDVDHHKKTLTVSVVPRDHMKKSVSNTKSLSGGERSYSTVAFLISLWSCVDHPFYFLDEYDVFTDEINRDYMTRLLVEEGRKRPMRQFTFLTPQDMSLMSEDFIKILRLSVPER